MLPDVRFVGVLEAQRAAVKSSAGEAGADKRSLGAEQRGRVGASPVGDARTFDWTVRFFGNEIAFTNNVVVLVEPL